MTHARSPRPCVERVIRRHARRIIAVVWNSALLDWTTLNAILGRAEATARKD